jgi:effector-binding domain-containing protein
MQTGFKVRDRGPALILSQRTTVRLATIGEAIGAGFAEVYGFLAPQAVASGEPFVIYHGAPGPGDRPFEIEICAPISRTIDPPAGWAVVELPAGTFASVVHVGSYDSLGVTYDELERWIAGRDLAIAGPPREIYLSEPSTPPADTRTVVEFPVVPAKAAVPALV